MGFVDGGAKIWPVTPDWEQGVTETLGWGTDVMLASATAVSQHRSYRALPRRSFAFEIVAAGAERQLADMLLAGYSGVWQLPIWPDAQWLGASIDAGAVSIPCATTGYDFVVGGKALLYISARVWEIVQVAAIAGDHLGLEDAISADVAAGARLFPLRRARVRQDAEERMRCLDVGRRGLTFDLAEPCDWPELDEPTTYLDHDVLDRWPDESDDPTSSYGRLEQTVDYETAMPVVHDPAGVALRAQKAHWKLFGREEHSWFRSLVYGRCGRLVPIWVPSFAADLQLADAIAASSAVLPVQWCGYTQFGLGKPNRKDVRIELVDQTVLYRRISASAEDGDAENLTLDAPLDDASIAPEYVRSISFMALSTLASDEVEIEHANIADVDASATTGFQAVVPDV